MSRSIHETRRTVDDLERLDVRDADRHEEALWLARDRRARKRTIKAGVRRIRRQPGSGSEIGPAAPPITVKDRGPHILYPLTPEDIDAFLAVLPPGAASGIAGVDLRLDPEPRSEDNFDPHVGRYPADDEWEPGMWDSTHGGAYLTARARIELYGLVCSGEATPLLPLRTHLLRLEMLSVLLHELAHHFDFTVRRSSPRWIADSTCQVEDYARASEQDLTKLFVAHFLERRFPEETEALLAWIEAQTELRTELARFTRSQHVQFGGLFEAAKELVTDVLAGTDEIERRVGFARMLHYGDDYDLALEACGLILAAHPEHAETLALIGDIHEHRGRLDEAIAFSHQALRIEPANSDALRTLILAHVNREEWDKVLAHSAALIEADAQATSPARTWHARALVELGRGGEIDADLEQLLSTRSRMRWTEAQGLEALRLLRSGDPIQALELANGALRDLNPFAPWIRAVSFEAAHRAGHPEEAADLSARHIEALRERGGRSWLDRLTREFGLQPSSGRPTRRHAQLQRRARDEAYANRG